MGSRTRVGRSSAARGASRSLALVLLALVLFGAGSFACSETPESIPIRTFERAQNMDIICLRVTGPGAPEPLAQEECAPVPPNVAGARLANQLFALVTQTTRGEVAVVDLTAGALVDQDHSVPGINFLPVGGMPTDIAATPDGKMAFVASGEPNKFAIYGIPGHRILGDAAARQDPEGAPTLASWPVCTLPQRPGSLTIVPRPPAPASEEEGEAVAVTAPYELVAVLPGDRTTSAKVVTIDPLPFLRGAPRRGDDGAPVDDLGEGVVLSPGQLAPCPITAAIELSGQEAVPASFRAGPTWADGIPWVDGGVDLACDMPERTTECGLPPCRCVGGSAPAGGDAGADAGEPAAEACEPDAGPAPPVEHELDLGPLEAPRPLAIARDYQTVYVADDGVPLIHVLDLSRPGEPRELEPFVVTSLVEPARVVSVGALAISPPTHEYRRFLYAVDRNEGSIAVFDVTDPETADRSPMSRPHPELNPFQPPDRIAFGAPVVSITFARHDWPLSRANGVPIANANTKTGLLCNPNPNLEPIGDEPARYGMYYRASSTDVDVGLGPTRLRGVFAFATLSNGQVVTIDVDDWDAPCRRPQTITGAEEAEDGSPLAASALAVAQPAPSSPDDLDPYHAPVAPPESVSQEVFVPVSAPHRLRSRHMLRDDTRTGRHVPFLSAKPQLRTPQAAAGPIESLPQLRPTALRPGASAGTEEPGVRFSFEAPDVHFDQDWTVVYEGALPGFAGLPGTLATTDDYASIVLSQSEARFCDKGVEDWAAGEARARAITSALAADGRPAYAERLERRLIDYVHVTDELLPPEDPLWSQADLPAPNSCWGPELPGARERYEACLVTFGSAEQPSENRDFPILEAYDDRVVLGRFATLPGNATREAIYSHPSNAAHLKLLRCCFHHQIGFEVRGGSQWVATGSSVGMLSHMAPDEGGRCVSSCDAREALLNARAPSLPHGPPGYAPDRNSPLAMRNPAFSFFVQDGQQGGKSVVPVRGMAWSFQTRGGFQPLIVDLAAQTTAVNPQSMRFLAPLGQIAVVDGASQGLILLDLSRVAVARTPYF